MKISFFTLKSNAIQAQQEIDWEGLKELFNKHDTDFKKKEDVPLFCPAEFKENSVRNANNAVKVHFGVLDLDKVSEETIFFLKEKLKDFKYISYTTWSHDPKNNKHCYRFIFPFDVPVLRQNWDRYWDKLVNYFNVNLDKKCKDVCRIYFMPACLDLSIHKIEHNEGKELSTEFIFSFVPKKEINSLIVDKEIEKLAKKLKLNKSIKMQEIGDKILLGLSGQSMADKGEQDDILIKIAYQLAETFPNSEASILAKPFEKALKVMAAGEPYKADWLYEKIERAQKATKQQLEETQKELEDSLSLKIKESFSGERSYPYTSEELQQFATKLKVPRDLLAKRWIVQNGKYYYIFHNGDYLPPILKDALSVACDTYLSPAITDNVKVWKESGKKFILKTEKELMTDYGTIAFSSEIDLMADCDLYDSETKTFIEAPCPLRKLTPEKNEQIQTWLELLGGENKDVLLDYISQITNLNEPCAALYIGETGGIGKSLLAMGLSRLWTISGPSSLKNILTNHNEEITRCPFIFADETMPPDLRKFGDTGELRELIQARYHTLNKKFRDRVPVKGCIRLMMAANNGDMLQSKENLTLDDINAISERFIYIAGNSKPAEYLKSLNPKDINAWIEEDKIAKHALWLRDTRVIEKRSRFLISGKDTSLARNMIVNTGLASVMFHWILSYLQDSTKVDILRTHNILIKNGLLLVTTKGFSDHWNMYDVHHPAPEPSKVSKVLTKICLKDKKSVKIGKNPKKFWIIDFENLVRWAEMNGYSTRQELHLRLSIDTNLIGVDVKEGEENEFSN